MTAPQGTELVWFTRLVDFLDSNRLVSEVVTSVPLLFYQGHYKCYCTDCPVNSIKDCGVLEVQIKC